MLNAACTSAAGPARRRYNARRQSRQEQRRQLKELKGLMYGLVTSDIGGTSDPLQVGAPLHAPPGSRKKKA